MAVPPDDWRRHGRGKSLTGLRFEPRDDAEVPDPPAHDRCESRDREFSHPPDGLREGSAAAGPDPSRRAGPDRHRDFAAEFGRPAPRTPPGRPDPP